jgi:hypothetical protein
MAKSTKFKIPESIDVFGKLYEIKQDPLCEEIHDCHGYHHEGSHLIILDSNLKPEVAQQTLLHECFHAIFKRLSFNQGIDSALEEVIVDSFAKWLVENFYIIPK